MNTETNTGSTDPVQTGSLARRSVSSLTWMAFAGLVTLPVSFIQMVLLARMLPVDYFGLQAGLVALVTLTYPPFELGLSAALLHRSAESQDEDRAMAVFFTLRLIFTTLWAFGLIVFALLALTGLRRQFLLFLVISYWLLRLSLTGQTLLVRRVEHRRLAVMDILQTGLASTLAVAIAYFTRSIWSLAVFPIVQAVVNWVLLALYRPVWRPRLKWDPQAMRYFLSFGARTMGGQTVAVALDYIDDLWTNLALGDVALGYYSRAYRLATYPRAILAEPVNAVSAGMYAELKGRRLEMSQAFFQVNALLVRSGFLLAGWLALIAPQFIAIFLGEKWLPMLPAFRLMLLYTLFDPIKTTVSNVLYAAGHPGQASLARFAQLLTLLAGLFVLGPRFGIEGVALAVDLMLAVGIGSLLFYARRYVDFSPLRLFGAPAMALVIGLISGLLAERLTAIQGSDWIELVVKTIIYGIIYLGVLAVFEKGKLVEAARWALPLINPLRK